MGELYILRKLCTIIGSDLAQGARVTLYYYYSTARTNDNLHDIFLGGSVHLSLC